MVGFDTILFFNGRGAIEVMLGWVEALPCDPVDVLAVASSVRDFLSGTKDSGDGSRGLLIMFGPWAGWDFMSGMKDGGDSPLLGGLGHLRGGGVAGTKLSVSALFV